MCLPILYSFRRCPYAMRARLALVAGRATVALREVSLARKPAAMLAVSPKGTVPVLVLPDGQVIDESRDIMRWAMRLGVPDGWAAETDEHLIDANDRRFKPHLDGYKYADRHGGSRIEHRTAAAEFLARLDRRLGDHAHLAGDRPSLADIALLPFVRQFADTDRAYFDLLPLPALQRWLADHLASALFARIMLRLEPWQPGDAPIAFPPAEDKAAPIAA